MTIPLPVLLAAWLLVAPLLLAPALMWASETRGTTPISIAMVVLAGPLAWAVLIVMAVLTLMDERRHAAAQARRSPPAQDDPSS